MTCITLERRIDSCRSLLQLFQNERDVLLSKEKIEAKDVLPMLKLKKRLIDKFNDDEGMVLESESQNITDESDEHRKELLRELSGLLEQLLVIDRENQRLLRNVLSTAGKSEPGRKNQQRYSTQEKAIR